MGKHFLSSISLNNGAVVGGAFTAIDLDDLPRATSAGGYTNANITVDQWGRVVAAASGAPGGITLFAHHVDAGNVGGAETDLYSDLISVNRLAVNDESLEAEYGGIVTSSAMSTREIKLYFGGTQFFDTGTLSFSASAAWATRVMLIRVSASVVRYVVSLTTQNAALSTYTAAGEITGLTLSGSNVLKITGQSSGADAATNDVVAKLGRVLWQPAP